MKSILTFFILIMPGLLQADTRLTHLINSSSLPLRVLEVRQSTQGIIVYYSWNDGIYLRFENGKWVPDMVWASSQLVPAEFPRILVNRFKGLDHRATWREGFFDEWKKVGNDKVLYSVFEIDWTPEVNYPQQFHLESLNDWIDNLPFGWMYVKDYPWIWFASVEQWGYVIENRFQTEKEFSSYWVFLSELKWCLFSETSEKFFVIDSGEWRDF